MSFASLWISACNTGGHSALVSPTADVKSSLAPNTNIFFVGYRQDKTIELWNSWLQKDSQVPMYIEPAKFPFFALPREEQFFLGNCQWNQECDLDLNDMFSNYWWGSLRLSPKKDMVAWTEIAEFCPPNLGYCDGGMTRIVLWKTNQLEKEVILEVPYHISLLYRQSIFSIEWSPNNHDISFIQASKEIGWSRLKIINIDSLEITEVGDDVTEYKWSPEGDKLAYITTHVQMDQKLIIVDPQGKSVFETVETFERITDYSWSPDGRKLVFTATDNEGNASVFILDLVQKRSQKFQGLLPPSSSYSKTSWSTKGTKVAIVQNISSEKTITKLYIIDIRNNSVEQPVMNDLSVFMDPSTEYVKLEWSADGNTIAVNVAAKDTANSSGVIFIDTSQNTIISRFMQENFPIDWRMSESSNAILVLFRNQSKNCPKVVIDRMGVYYWDKNMFDEIILNPLLINDMKNCTLSIADFVFGGKSTLQRPEP